jgi:hypothetical protein
VNNGSAVPAEEDSPEPVQRSVQKGEGIYESLLMDQQGQAAVQQRAVHQSYLDTGENCSISAVQWSVQRGQGLEDAVQRSVQRPSRLEPYVSVR